MKNVVASKLVKATSTKAQKNMVPIAPVTNRSAFVRATRIPELMASDIRLRIVRGELPEGASLPPEAELMAQYAVSRPTLREALRILESESLILVRRGGIGGAVVMRPSLDSTARNFSLILQLRGASVTDAYRARLVIEPPALSDLARTAKPADVKLIKEKLDHADTLVGSPDKYAHAVTELRELIIALSGNITLSLLARLLDEILERYSAQKGYEGGAEWVKLQQKSQRSLRKLVEYIEAKDPAGAATFWRKHLEEAGKYLFNGEEMNIQIVDLLNPSVAMQR
jgi:DNA-binding FadR family transcriptional regulator